MTATRADQRLAPWYKTMMGWLYCFQCSWCTFSFFFFPLLLLMFISGHHARNTYTTMNCHNLAQHTWSQSLSSWTAVAWRKGHSWCDGYYPHCAFNITSNMRPWTPRYDVDQRCWNMRNKWRWKETCFVCIFHSITLLFYFWHNLQRTSETLATRSLVTSWDKWADIDCIRKVVGSI